MDQKIETNTQPTGIEGLACAVFLSALKDLQHQPPYRASAVKFLDGQNPSVLEFWLVAGGVKSKHLDAAKATLRKKVSQAIKTPPPKYRQHD